MSNSTTSVFDLTVAEKLQLIEDLWDDISFHPDYFPIEERQKEELARRKARYLAYPGSGLSWDEVQRRIRTRMLLDENHPKLSLALLILYEAHARKVSQVEFCRQETSFDVVYFTGESAEKRDAISSRHWHGLVSAFHLLAGVNAIRHALKGPEGAVRADSLLNRIEINRDSLQFMHNSHLQALQNRLEGSLIVEMSFTDTLVRLTLLESKDA